VTRKIIGEVTKMMTRGVADGSFKIDVFFKKNHIKPSTSPVYLVFTYKFGSFCTMDRSFDKSCNTMPLES
jgi:hypothetical protein